MFVALIATGCAKTPSVDEGSSDRWSFTPPPETFAGAKTSWNAGDRIYVFFDDETTKNATDASELPYLMLERNSGSWMPDDSKAPSVLPESGTLMAIHCPNSSQGPSCSDGRFYVGTPGSWCMYMEDVKYNTVGDKITFSLQDMSVPEGMAQILVPAEGLDKDKVYALSVYGADDKSAGICPVSISFSPADGKVDVAEGACGDDLSAGTVSGGYMFSGKAVVPVEGKIVIELIEKDDEGEDLGEPYTYVLTGVTEENTSWELPPVSGWICTPTESKNTVLYNDGTLVINEMKGDHVANAIKHNGVFLLHPGLIGNLDGESTNEDGTFKLPWRTTAEDALDYNPEIESKRNPTAPFDTANEWQMNIKHIEFGSELQPSTMKYAFFNLVKLETMNTTNLKITSDKFRTNNALKETFKFCPFLKEIDVSDWDVSEVTTMEYAFHYCKRLPVLDVSNWDVSSVKDMRGLFRVCEALTVIDLSKWETSSVEELNEMFRGCKNVEVLDLSGFDTAFVTCMKRMFYQCYKLKTIYVTDNFQTQAVTSSDEMFYELPLLVGGNGTAFGENRGEGTKEYDGIEYACIDGTDGKPGYFTEKQ